MAVLIGQLTAGTSDFVGNGAPSCSRYQAVATGTLVTLSVQLLANAGLTSLKLAVYTDIGGPLPGALLTEGQLTTGITGAGLKVITVPGLAVTSGTFYWLAVLGNGEALDFSAAAGSYREDATGKTNFDANWITAGDAVGGLNLPILGEDAGIPIVGNRLRRWQY